MIKKIKYVFLLSILFTIGICTHSFARITTNDPTVNSGENVTITINSQEPVASGAINISSNSGLTFKSVTGGTANGTLLAFSKTNNATSGIATYTFTAPEVSKDTVYKVVFSSQDMTAENGTAIANSTATATVTVKAKEGKPDNTTGGNNGNSDASGGNTSGGTQTPNPESKPEPEKVKLQSLKINNTTYIKQLKTNLYVTVEGQEDITLLPKTSDASSCTVTNNTNKETYTVKSGESRRVKLNEGTNKITVTGNFDETYTITVTNKKKEEETLPNVIDEQDEKTKVILKSLIIKGVKENEEKVDFVLTPEFSSEIYEYSINIPKEQNDITKLDVEAIGNKEDYTVEVTGNENIGDGETVITILVKSKDGEKTAEYKIIVNKEAKSVEAFTEPVLDETPNTGVEDNSKDIIKVSIVGVIALIVAITIIFILIKYRNRNEDDENEILEEKYDKELEEEPISKIDIEVNDEIENKEENVGYESDYIEKEEDNKPKGIDFTSILKNKINQKNEISKIKRLAKTKEEDFEDVEETFEVLKEEDTSSKKRGKHF